MNGDEVAPAPEAVTSSSSAPKRKGSKTEYSIRSAGSKPAIVIVETMTTSTTTKDGADTIVDCPSNDNRLEEKHEANADPGNVKDDDGEVVERAFKNSVLREVSKEEEVFNFSVAMAHQKILFYRGIFIFLGGGVIVGVTILLQTAIETFVIGKSGYAKIVTEDTEDFIYADTFKGLDFTFLEIIIATLYWMMNASLATIYLGKDKGSKIMKYYYPLSLLYLALGIWACVVYNDGVAFVTWQQLFFLDTGSKAVPEVIMVAVSKGVNAKLPMRVFRRLAKPIFSVIIGYMSCMYLTFNKITEDEVVINTFIMSVGFPTAQFITRSLFEKLMRSVIYAGKSIQTGPLTVMVEGILSYPALFSQFQAKSEVAFYVSISVSLLIEVVELVPFVKLAVDEDNRPSMLTKIVRRGISNRVVKVQPKSSVVKSSTSSSGTGGSQHSMLKALKIDKKRIGLYVANAEQAEKIALLCAIGFSFFLNGFSTSLMMRSFYGLFTELLADVAKGTICSWNNILFVPTLVAWTTDIKIFYILTFAIASLCVAVGLFFLAYIFTSSHFLNG